MGYMGTIYGIVAASIIHGMGEGVFSTYAATIRQSCLTKSHATE